MSDQQLNGSGIHDGQWYVVAFRNTLRPGHTLLKTIADQEIVFWRSQDGVHVQAASAVCPHWGGPLGEGAVAADGALTCPWHGWQFHGGRCRQRTGLKLPRYLAYDDGLLLWVRLPWNVEDVNEPPCQARPTGVRSFWFDVLIESDVYHVQENYLDFLHPAEYHTTVFNHCVHLGKEGDVNLVELGYRLPFRRTMMTRTRVWAPTPYQIRNEVYEGLGAGMVIESHLTPLAADRTLIHELYHVPARLAPRWIWPVARYFMQRSARTIRAEDALFAQRRYLLRSRGFVDGRGLPVNGRVAPYLDEWPESVDAKVAQQKLSRLMGKKAPSHY
ncbi:MAG: Rieske (2Fe-2S) protein [Caldilineaceae bacterium]|nr:Rieske (2Fe-2S) protein [Caldilineaceae bacterium]